MWVGLKNIPYLDSLSHVDIHVGWGTLVFFQKKVNMMLSKNDVSLLDSTKELMEQTMRKLIKSPYLRMLSKMLSKEPMLE